MLNSGANIIGNSPSPKNSEILSFLDFAPGQKSKKLRISEFFGLGPERLRIVNILTKSPRAWPFSKAYPGGGGNDRIPVEGQQKKGRVKDVSTVFKLGR